MYGRGVVHQNKEEHSQNKHGEKVGGGVVISSRT